MPQPDLDRWLAKPMVRTRHRREAAAAVGEPELWGAAASVRLRDCRVLGRLIRARIPGLAAATTFSDLFHDPPFNLLDEGPSWTLSGLCGRIWTVRRDFAVLDAPQDFTAWAVPGTVRVLFATWAEPAAGGGAALVSEVRIAAVDRRAGLYVHGLRPFISSFQGLVGSEPLNLAVARATAAAAR